MNVHTRSQSVIPAVPPLERHFRVFRRSSYFFASFTLSPTSILLNLNCSSILLSFCSIARRYRSTQARTSAQEATGHDPSAAIPLHAEMGTHGLGDLLGTDEDQTFILALDHDTNERFGP
jgi:hypothetical protein